MNLRGQQVLLRLDWNVPLVGSFAKEDTLKLERSLDTIHLLQRRGAIVIVLTHLGRPKDREPELSTKRLVAVLKHRFRLEVNFHGQSVSVAKERKALLEELSQAEPGTVHLLENVRFEPGEEKNEAKLAKAYASPAKIFINDAFASSHRAHTSIVGIAKHLPAYAGPQLAEEVRALSAFLEKPKRPFLVVIGGLKLSTKIPVLKVLLTRCDKLLVGGAMATTLAAALGQKVGKSFVEKTMLKTAKAIAQNPKIMLPVDVMVTKKLDHQPKLVRRDASALEKDDLIVDVGLKTLKAWGDQIKTANTLLWNGPVGIAEIHSCGAGSRFLARAIAARSRGKAYGVVGGGDTLPVIYATKTEHQFDHVSMGGGALLEFLEKKGKLPGLLPLMT